MESAGSIGCQRVSGEPSFYTLFRDPWPLSSIHLGCHSDQLSKLCPPSQYLSQSPNLHVCGWMGQHHTSPFWGAMWDCPSVLSNDLSFRRTHSGLGKGISWSSRNYKIKALRQVLEGGQPGVIIKSAVITIMETTSEINLLQKSGSCGFLKCKDRWHTGPILPSISLWS